MSVRPFPAACCAALLCAPLAVPSAPGGRALTEAEAWAVTGGAEAWAVTGGADEGPGDPVTGGCCDLADRCEASITVKCIDRAGACNGSHAKRTGESDGEECRPYEVGDDMPADPSPCNNVSSGVCVRTGFCTLEIVNGAPLCQFVETGTQTAPQECWGEGCG